MTLEVLRHRIACIIGTDAVTTEDQDAAAGYVSKRTADKIEGGEIVKGDAVLPLDDPFFAWVHGGFAPIPGPDQAAFIIQLIGQFINRTGEPQ